LYNNVFAPAQDAMYNALVSALDKAFEKKDDTKLAKQEQHDKVRKSVGKALRAYFERVSPHVVKAMDDLKMDDLEQYEHLSTLYDEHTLAGKVSKDYGGIRKIVDDIVKEKKTIGHLKRRVYDTKSAGAQFALLKLGNQYMSHHFSKYQPTQVAAYLKPKLEKAGFEVEDKIGYAQADLGELFKLREGILEKKGHQYLKKKPEEEKKK
jgi:hypothetical protein